MTLAAFLIIQCVMLAAWWRLLALQRRLSVSERLLIAGVGYFTQIIASGIALGLLHRLTPQRHLQANLLITLAIVVFAMTRPIPARTARPLLPPLGAGGLRVVNLALLGTLMLTLVAIVRRAAIAMTPGYDALTYHLPMVVSMIKQHHLRPWATYIPIVYSYPKSVQLYMTWVLGFFGHDRWIDLSQLPFLPLAMLAVYCIARHLRAARAAALTGALLFPFCPVVLMQLTTCYIDLATAALLLAAIGLLLIYARHAQWWTWLMFSASLGLLLGTKFAAVYQVAVLLTAGICVGRRISPVWRALVATGVVLAVGGETYLHNAIERGNPFFPYHVDIAGLVQFAGWWDPTKIAGLVELADLTPLQRIAASWAYVEHVGHTGPFAGLGMMWPVAMLFILAAVLLAIRRCQRRALLVAALFALLFLLTPLNFRARFVIFMLGLSGACVALVLDHVARLRAWRGPMMALTAAVCLAMPAITIRQVAPRLAADVVGDAGARTQPYDDVTTAHTAAYRWVRDHVGDGERVVFFKGDYACFHYLLWNERFSNTVRFDYDRGPDAFAKTASRHADAYLVIPRQARLYDQYVSQADRFQTLFEAPSVVIVREKR